MMVRSFAPFRALLKRQPMLFNASAALPSIQNASALSGMHLVRGHCDSNIPPNAKSINLVFIDKDGKKFPVVGKEGQNLVHLAHENDIDLEGACECSLACSTCHVILQEEVYDSLDEPTDEEEDLLDLAFGLTETSRLGCQVILKADMEGAEITLPAATRNFYVDGHKPKPH